MAFGDLLPILILLLYRLHLISAGVFCYVCYGISISQGSACNFNNVCYGDACITTMNTNGQWNSTCANDGSPSLYAQLNGTQCAKGSLSGHTGTFATCSCNTYFCNAPESMTNPLENALSSTTAAVEPTIPNALTCFECGTVDGTATNIGPSQVNVSCDGSMICQGNLCLTRKSVNPRSYCASPWMGNLTLGCTKTEGEDELCVCDQSMCNYPYDPLQPVPTFATTTTTVVTTRAAGNGSTCVDGFQLVSSNVDPSSAAMGKFGGYFQAQSSCQDLCRLDYGLLPCIGYMYEPNNRGKCTIFQYSINGFSSNTNQTTVIEQKCG